MTGTDDLGEAIEHQQVSKNRRDIVLAVVVAVITLFSAYSGYTTWLTSRALRATVACQGQVNEELRDAVVFIEDSKVEHFDAQRALLFAPPTTDSAQRAAHIARYGRSLDAIQAARRASPFPTRDC